MSATEKLIHIRHALKELKAYPKPSEPRRTKDGYPLEVSYDEWAYKRMVDSYRDAIKQILDEYK